MAGIIPNFRKKGPNTVGQRTNDELWTRTGTFINKPVHGWLHPEEKLKHGGICYGVRYVGCLEVKQSTRTLPFEVRGQVTKEAIFRVCDASGFNYVRKKKANRNIVKVLGDTPNVQFGGANVNLTISTTSINLTVMETGKVIANHQMQGISFASGGDQETPDYVAYVAKDPVNGRACHVLECLSGLAQDVITTVGQAFEIRFKEYLKNPPQAFNAPDKFAEPIFGEGESAWGEDPEYYNDITKLDGNERVSPEPSAPPQLGPGQYMAVNGPLPPNPYASLRTPQSPSSDTMPSAPVYDNRGEVLPNCARHLEREGSPASPLATSYMSDQNNPALSSSSMNSQSSQPVDMASNIPVDTLGSASSGANDRVVRKTPTLYEPHKLREQFSVTSRENPSSWNEQGSQKMEREWDKLKDNGYDNFRVLQEAERIASNQQQHSGSSKADSTIYNMPKTIAPGYDNPPQPMPRSSLGLMGEGVYNESPHSGLEEGVYNSNAHSFSSPTMSDQNGGHRTDMFDMEPFNPSNAKKGPVPLNDEEWFHGPMSRREGEALLEEDGDFLVRESTSSKGQYVLSGMQNGQPKHLLLVDPKGKVRTKDKEFDSVSHLIEYHRSLNLPIISAGSAVFLKHPVLNARAAGNFNH
ncbi:SHC-transforming protein 1 [Holothuria leucospilota]|uniref:SHC-transforming protein 1 n=1 Tax=Holothuria leucospilota TaxID=206669 RepID=A0A9Q1BN31_HOLLE|nr:SHC-transforming protein 1 [Holothuria leucospilota]